MSVTRLGVLLLALFAVVLVWFSVRFALLSWNDLQQAEYTLSEVKEVAQKLPNLKLQMQQYVEFQDDVNGLNQRIAQRHLLEDEWVVKHVDIRHMILPRADVQGFMSGMLQRPNQFFIPKAFELRVMNNGDDLFQWKGREAGNLNLLIEGDYLVRRTLR
ncbi:MAG: hypothetical protein IE936_00195 [Moraxella osloensis]|nr:hypothetical protein [Moraxella osloensis]MBD3767413.1 hypothetical protein [Gammaproteobacteria bacterium]